jgi:DamX protein
MTFILESVRASFFNELPNTVMSALETPSLVQMDDSLTGTSHEYFATPELMQRLNLIRHLIQHSGQLLLVLAEAGYGKTALLTRLCDSASEHWWVHVPQTNPALSPDALVSSILSAFRVRHDGKSSQALLDSLRSHLAATRYNNQLPVLLVDDAHLLPLATLKLLVELAMQGESLTRMRVVIFCEPQITSILATPEFELVHNTLIHTLDIPPLSRTQVRGYIQIRLQGTRYNQYHLFTDEVIRKIYQQSGGVPAKINPLIQQILTKFAEQWPVKPRRLDRTPSYIKLLLISLLIIALISIVLTVRWFYPELFQKAVTSPQVEMTFPIKQDSPLDNTEDELFSNYPILSPPDDIEKTNPFYTLDAEETMTPLVEPDATPQENPIAEIPSDILDEQEDTDIELVQLLGDEVKGKAWIQRQQPTMYTLQVLGAHDIITLKQFLARSLLEVDKVAVLKTIYQNKEWYILLYGVYADRSEATMALEALPVSLRQDTQPWARKWKDIQTLLK